MNSRGAQEKMAARKRKRPRPVAEPDQDMDDGHDHVSGTLTTSHAVQPDTATQPDRPARSTSPVQHNPNESILPPDVANNDHDPMSTSSEKFYLLRTFPSGEVEVYPITESRGRRLISTKTPIPVMLSTLVRSEPALPLHPTSPLMVQSPPPLVPQPPPSPEVQPQSATKPSQAENQPGGPSKWVMVGRRLVQLNQARTDSLNRMLGIPLPTVPENGDLDDDEPVRKRQKRQ
ncbi:hypothetical protein P153DRAFT_145362 [Dothidotthia symphoricarpi CBS 119687]|uniref:Uncharacterized protein n=1 Tax=Dothidotthia symphoricarpi CBS 119687 TaxID=1392245 RepID=A0A6A5ZXW1_9PLEO|nr:uncharacterized protein P153DRAFT_145362 [Dothidotthia symphoricarpi CBS 119687]KAF2123743.1 hypothetical protein P153DRAFT_145362 [Dothidotthia symphoricarpi CBS 119687]